MPCTVPGSSVTIGNRSLFGDTLGLECTVQKSVPGPSVTMKGGHYWELVTMKGGHYWESVTIRGSLLGIGHYSGVTIGNRSLFGGSLL